MQDFYVDRFIKFNVSQGVARLDFVRMDSFNPDKKEISMSPAGRVVMPLEGFMHFADEVAKIRAQIVAQGSKAPDADVETNGAAPSETL